MSSVPAVLIAPSKLESAIERLPAEQRARLHWAPERLRRMLDRLLVDGVTRQLVNEVTADFIRLSVSIVRDILPLLLASEGASEGVLTFDQLAVKLAAYFKGLPAAEGIEWTAGVLKKAYAHQDSQVSLEEFIASIEDIDVSGVEESVQHAPMSILRAQLILQALLHAAERGIPAEHLEELAERAYLEAAQSVDLWAMQGVDLDPLKDLTPGQRFQKALRAIEHLREVVTPDDLDVMARTRVPSLS